MVGAFRGKSMAVGEEGDEGSQKLGQGRGVRGREGGVGGRVRGGINLGQKYLITNQNVSEKTWKQLHNKTKHLGSH